MENLFCEDEVKSFEIRIELENVIENNNNNNIGEIYFYTGIILLSYSNETIKQLNKFYIKLLLFKDKNNIPLKKEWNFWMYSKVSQKENFLLFVLLNLHYTNTFATDCIWYLYHFFSASN